MSEYYLFNVPVYFMLLVWKCCFMDQVMADESKFTIKEQVMSV